MTNTIDIGIEQRDYPEATVELNHNASVETRSMYSILTIIFKEQKKYERTMISFLKMEARSIPYWEECMKAIEITGILPP